MKKFGIALSILVILSLVLVSSGVAQSGVGYIKQLFANRAVIQDNSSGVALTVSQAGASGMAVVVTDGVGFPVMAIDDTGDVLLAPDKTGGNEGAVVTYAGVPRLELVGTGMGTDANDAGDTVDFMDATPATEWITFDADTICATEAAYSRDTDGTSLEIDFLAAGDANDGCIEATLATNLDWTNTESLAFWLYVEGTDLALGDLHLVVVDSSLTSYIDIPACPIAKYWYWINLEAAITAFAGADANDVDGLGLELSAAGAAKALAEGGFVVYVDGMYKWEVADQETLGIDVLRDGVLSVVDTITGALLVQDTDYFIDYNAANDFLVWIGDEDAVNLMVLAAVQP